MEELLGIGLALIGGALGQKVGKSPLTGEKPWNKVLAPALAIGTGLLYKTVTGADLDAGQTMQAGTMIGGQAVAVYTVAKNTLQLVKTLF